MSSPSLHSLPSLPLLPSFNPCPLDRGLEVKFETIPKRWVKWGLTQGRSNFYFNSNGLVYGCDGMGEIGVECEFPLTLTLHDYPGNITDLEVIDALVMEGRTARAFKVQLEGCKPELHIQFGRKEGEKEVDFSVDQKDSEKEAEKEKVFMFGNMKL